jgi:hypothetical protein
MWAVPSWEFATPDRFRNIIDEMYSTNKPTSEADVDAFSKDLVDRKFVIYDWKVKLHFRNVSQHPVFFTLYHIKPKKHVILTSSDTDKAYHIARTIMSGWMQEAPNTANAPHGTYGGPTVKDDDDLFDTGGLLPLQTKARMEQGEAANGRYFDTVSSMHWPTQSAPFNQFYKIHKKITVRMIPGDDLYYKFKVPKFQYQDDIWTGLDQPHQSKSPYASGDFRQAISLIKNVSSMFLIRMHGALGVGTTVDTQDSGYMTGHMVAEYQERAKIYMMGEKKKRTLTAWTLDTVGETLVGPSEHVETAEGL